MKEALYSICSVILTTIVYYLGGLDVALQTLLIAIVIDYITGIIKAFTLKKLNSKLGFVGLLKKIGVLCLVALSVLIDNITGNTGAVRTLVIYYFVANEGLSIIENLGKSGIPIPKKLEQAIVQLKGEEESEAESK